MKRKIWVYLYLQRVGSAASQLLNVLLFVSKRPNESLSGRSYRRSRDGSVKWQYMQTSINWFFMLFGQKDHCRKAYLNDIVEARLMLIEYDKYYKGAANAGRHRVTRRTSERYSVSS